MTADRDDLAAINRNHADGTPRRLAACAQANPANDDYHPGCCRFPKSCSPYPYAETPVTESDLEPRRDQPPAADRDDLAAILAKHWHQYPMQTHDGYHPNACSCGEPIDDPGILAPLSEAMAIHRAHVAQMVLESDWLRGVRAKELRDWADELDKPPYDLWDRAAIPRLRDRADRVDTEDGGR